MAKKSRFNVDRKKIVGLFGKVNAQVYEWYGKDVRNKARKSLRKPNKKRNVSQPGEPPVSQTGTLKDTIFYELDETRGVVIGPVRFKGRYQGAKALEYGGKTTTKIGRKKRSAKIKARPFMRPAREKVDKTLPDKYRRARERQWK